jgi:hypothetical protein
VKKVLLEVALEGKVISHIFTLPVPLDNAVKPLPFTIIARCRRRRESVVATLCQRLLVNNLVASDLLSGGGRFADRPNEL